MSRSKLSLPFSQACKLNEEQKRKLVECQAKRISIEEWEIKALLDLCMSNGSIDKGLAVLYEYAGYVDEFKRTVERRSICVEDVIDFVSGINTGCGNRNVLELVEVTEKAASLTVKSIHILSKWRRLQCCPRPVHVEEKMGGKWTFQFLLKDEAKRFSDVLFQSFAHVTLFDLIPLGNLVALLAPFIEYESFLELVKYQQKYLSGARSTAGRAQTQVIDINALMHSASPVREMYASIREMISLEDRIGASWDSIRSLAPHSPSGDRKARSPGGTMVSTGRYSPDPSRLFPTLRLPYRNFRAPTEDLAWFVPSLPRYQELDGVISRISSQLLTIVPSPAPVRESVFQEIARAHERPADTLPPSPSPRVATNEDAPSPTRPAGAALAFVRSRSSNLKGLSQPGSRKTNVKLTPGGETVEQMQLEMKDVTEEDQIDIAQQELKDDMEATVEFGVQTATVQSASLLPHRGNNNSEPDALPPSSSQSVTPSVVGTSGLFSPSGTERKRSVTLAVVSQSGPSAVLLREAVDLRRRVTHAGTMSSTASAHSVSASNSLVLEDDEDANDDEEAHDQNQEILLDATATVTPVGTDPQVAETVTIEPRENPAMTLMSPISLRVVTPGSAPVVIPLEIMASPDFATIPPGYYSAAQTSREAISPANQSIIKQTSLSSEQSSFKKPSQIIRAASEGRYKTLSFDSVLDEDVVSPHGAPGRPRNISYEIIYQESFEDRLFAQQAYLQQQPGSGIFQATPSPLLNRKRAQSTPLNLGNYSHLTTSNTPFSPTLRHSPSFDAVYSPLTHASGATSSSADYPARTVYRGRNSSPGVRSMNSARRNFSARSRERAEEAPHFMETFGMLDSLSKPYTRGESMAESQIIHIALRNMRVEGVTLVELAAHKLSVWWRLVCPRKKLLRRISLRDHCRDLVLGMVDSAVAVGISKQRRRRTLLRNGAAMRIQRMFRFWSTTILVAARLKELQSRGRAAWHFLSVWGNAVLVGLKIFRYVRSWQQRRMSRKVLKLNGAHVLRRTMEKYFQVRTLRKKYEEQFQYYTKLKVASIMSANYDSTSTLSREKDLAVACIQKCFRAYMLRRLEQRKHHADIMGTKLTYFFIRCIARRRVKLNKKRNAAAVVIQTFCRGVRTRAKILRIVRSGLLLNSLWRKHKEYVNLKSQLRRVDRPHTLVIHGIRNIAKKTINSEQIKFKVSVWWHPLLHIVSQNDINVIITTKQPQFIFNSSAFYLVDTAVQRGSRRMSFAQSFRKLSNLITPYTSRRQSTLNAPQPVNMTSRGVFRYSQVLAEGSTSFTSSARASIASVFGNNRGSNAVTLPAITERRESKAIVPSNSLPGQSSPTPVPSSHSPLGGGTNRMSFGGRKESVEVMRPSALAAQLAIIHSDDEEEEDEEEEEGVEAGTGSRKLPSRSFISKRMGVTSAKSPGKSSASNSDSGDLSPVNEDDEPVFNGTVNQVQTPGKSWARVSKVVKGVTQSELALDTGSQGDPSSADWSDSSNSPKPAPHMSLTSPTSSLLLRSTLNFMAPLRGKTRTNTTAPVEEPKMICNFHDVIVKIPGCHGNSVIKIEILEGDRKYGNCHFFLSKEGNMMFWGGEYQRNVNLLQQRRAVQFNSHIINARNPRGAGGVSVEGDESDGRKKGRRSASSVGSSVLNPDEPIIDFRIIAGAPLRSKCSWGRVAVRGSGPLKRILKSRDFLSSFLFDKWHRLYFSLDETGLYLFDNKFNTTPLHFIPVKDLKEVSVDVGAPIKQSSADAAKNISEDIHNVKLVTFTGDDLYMRFPDTMTRITWQEGLTNAILQQKCSNAQHAASRRAWVAKAVEGDSALKGRGILATALADSSSDDPLADPPLPQSPKKTIFAGFGRAASPSPKGRPNHVQRLMRLRSESALGPITGGGSNHYGSGGLLSSVPPSPQDSPQVRPVGPDLVSLARLSAGSSPSPKNLVRKQIIK